MINLPLANILINFIAVVWLLSALLLIGIILIQKGKGGGLSGAFGGGMGGGLLGSKTGDFLTWVTIGLVGMFLTLAVVMAKYYKPEISEYEQPTQQAAPAAPQLPDMPAGQAPVQTQLPVDEVNATAP